MNCIKHNDVPGVAQCAVCGVGLCGKCVQNALRVENKPWCDQCVVEDTKAYKQVLENEITAFNKKRTIWTVILIVGLFVFLGGFFTTQGAGAFITAFIIWGFGGFFTRMQKAEIVRQNQDTQTALSNALLDRDLERSGAIWFVWLFKLAFFLIRGAFFPFVYAYVMFQGTKELQAQIEECDRVIETYSNR